LGDKDVKQHPWFASIDFAKLDKKEIDAPFKPKVSSESDISQIDPVFTQETAVDSLVERSVILDTNDANFENFSYINPNAMEQT